MTTKRKAIGYTRVSTGRQAEEGVSLDVQRNRIEAFCVAQNWDLEDIRTDEGKSARGGSAIRLEQQYCIDFACEHKGVIVFYSLSRLARSVGDAYTIAGQLDKCGADMASVTEPIDTSTAMGKAFFGLIAIFAELESNQISERVSASINHIIDTKGFNPTGSQPYGWTVIKGKAVRVPEEQTIISEIRLRTFWGESLRHIAAILNGDKIRPPRGGKQWNHSTISKILKNQGPKGRKDTA